jgi:hypothetical protein
MERGRDRLRGLREWLPRFVGREIAKGENFLREMDTFVGLA